MSNRIWQSYTLVGSIILAVAIIFITRGCNVAHAEEVCFTSKDLKNEVCYELEKPRLSKCSIDQLSPELKEAYFELRELFKNEEGISVEIKCE